MTSRSTDDLLRKCLRLAARGRYGVSPNPRVGAVVWRPDLESEDGEISGRVVGEGSHRRPGGAHAEIHALRQAGSRARGATVFVNLEPCSHHGRTPPCADALIEAGVARVIACHRDPNPQVAGRGFARLREAGVEVRILDLDDALVRDAVALNLPFLVSTVHRRPFVTLKWAMSLDGRIATATGHSQWISGPAARRRGLALREEHDAILVGSGTALADDPQLDRRLGLADGPIARVILDRRLRLPATAKTLKLPGQTLVYAAASTAQGGRAEPRRQLEEAGATIVALDEPNPPTVLADLYDRGIRSVLVEGGGEVIAAFVEAPLYDRVWVDCAPLLIGGDAAPGPIRGSGIDRLNEAPRLDDLRSRRRGEDLIITGTRSGCLPALLKSVGES